MTTESLSKTQKWYLTILLLCTAVFTGMSDGLIGPTLPDLALVTSRPATRVSTVFTWRACFAIAGSLISGYLFDRLDVTLVMATSLVLQATFAAIAPWLPHLIAMSVILGMFASFNAALNTGIYTLAFRSWGGKAAPVVQALRMCYTAGLAVAPFVAEPFIHDSTDSFPENFTVSTISTPYNHTTIYIKSEDTNTRVGFAYIVVAVTAIVWAILYLLFGYFCGLKLKGRPSEKDMVSHEGKAILLVALTLLLTVVYGGMDVGISGLLMTYVTKYLLWPTSEGILISSVYQCVKIAVLFVTVFLSLVLHPRLLVGADVLLLLLASTVMMGTAWQYTQAAMWVCTIMLAAGLANLHASNMSWLGHCISVTSKISACFNVAFSCGIMTIPPLTGLALHNLHLYGLPAVILTCSITCVLLSALLLYFHRITKSARRSANNQDSDKPLNG